MGCKLIVLNSMRRKYNIEILEFGQMLEFYRDVVHFEIHR